MVVSITCRRFGTPSTAMSKASRSFGRFQSGVSVIRMAGAYAYMCVAMPSTASRTVRELRPMTASGPSMSTDWRRAIRSPKSGHRVSSAVISNSRICDACGTTSSPLSIRWGEMLHRFSSGRGSAPSSRTRSM
jgi:hypothetical protein